MPFQTNAYLAHIFYFLSLFFLTCFSFNAYTEESWQQLTPGIEYQELLVGILTPWSRVHVFRIDLSKHQLELISAKKLALKNASTDLFAKKSHALISINGGFFDHDFKPLGLRKNHKKLESQLKPISWWGIFYIKNNKAFISSLKHFKDSNDIELALQSGPRLLIKKTIPSLKTGKDDRSAIGITQEGKLILLVTTNAPMNTEELALLMRSSPMYCTDAINLDGGSSSQLYAQINSFKLKVHGFSNVSDAIVVKPIG